MRMKLFYVKPVILVYFHFVILVTPNYIFLNYSLTNENDISNIDTDPIAACSQYTSADTLKNKAVNKELSFLHVNIRSLSKNISLLEELMTSYRMLPDIIGICETKLNNNNILDLIMLNKYSFHYTNSFSKAGGVGIYINNSMTYTLRSDLIFHSANYESIWVELSVGVNSKKILVGLIYRHPGTSVTEFTKQFSDFLSNITLQNKDICIFGDININLLKNDKEQSIKNYMMKFVDLVLLM